MLSNLSPRLLPDSPISPGNSLDILQPRLLGLRYITSSL